MNFVTDVVFYTKNSPVFREKDSIGYEFTNLGNSLIYINNRLINPSEVWNSFSPLMVDLTLYRVEFRTNPSFPSPQTNNCQVVIYSKR